MREWYEAYRWMKEWGGVVKRAHLTDATAPPVSFRGLDGIRMLWAEKGGGYKYMLFDAVRPCHTGPLAPPPDGDQIPNGPLNDGGCGWVEPDPPAPPVSRDCKVEKSRQSEIDELRADNNQLLEENDQLRYELLDALRELRGKA